MESLISPSTPAEAPSAGVGFAGRWALVLFDVDSTLITGEVIDMLAARTDRADEVARVTEEAMCGRLDFAESLRRRVALLAGLAEGVVAEVGAALTLTPGAREVVAALHESGARCGVASGGFTQVCDYLVDGLGLDFCAANTLEIRDGYLTGRLIGPIVDRAGKAETLRSQARAHGVDLANTVAVGDGANDIDVARAAGLSIAFNGRSALIEHADVSITGPSLLPVLGVLREHAARRAMARPA